MDNYLLTDLRRLEWTKIRKTSGTAGSFLKSFEEKNGKKIYYKLSDYNSVDGIIGHECVNEIIVDRLLNILGVEHLHYNLIFGKIMIDGLEKETYLCYSNDFKEIGEQKIALDTFYNLKKENNISPLEYCIKIGWEKYIYEMIVVDYLILNRDRHGANIEVLQNKKNKTIRLAPLFDHGISLLCRCKEEDLDDYDVLSDKRVQSFVGTNSVKENLNLIPKDKLPKFSRLSEFDKNEIFKGLDGVISQKRINKIWELIWKRWCVYEDLCNKE